MKAKSPRVAPPASDLLQRRGVTTVHETALNAAPALIAAAMAGGIVTRAETLWHTDAIRYNLCHPAFDVVKPGDVIPDYSCVITAVEDGTPAISWSRT